MYGTIIVPIMSFKLLNTYSLAIIKNYNCQGSYNILSQEALGHYSLGFTDVCIPTVLLLWREIISEQKTIIKWSKLLKYEVYHYNPSAI